ncbi:ChbG/HpnK family deacetylase [Azoarcus olearius]|uniref:Cellobiose phosphorylase n=1 Tax=Azoarcus sp. (strain BH72) TaxID=418699 RepID=A1K3G0_AZOSB|nr:ChbG/HpnK family deacetylase [Azoarcus olearius]ANQ83892.1 cellobiose phosphorylase [Azoarcus olearius]CAL93365.1 cellobiose phosphorylase [Azoarcus olearius]
MTAFFDFHPVVVCADDYGIAAGVSTAIAQLIEAGRLSATSCMSTLPDWRRAAPELRAVVARQAADVGLHLTLTDHHAATPARGLADHGRLPPLGRVLRQSLAGGLPRAAVRDELRAQLDAFEDAWGAPPDYIDGHQHVHLFAGVREAVVDEVARRYPLGRVWVRDCVEAPARCVRRGVATPKALFLASLGRPLRRLLRTAGIPANDGFSGLHDFASPQPFGAKMRRFLALPGPRPLVHVHPGRVDAELRACDSLTTPREAELAYLASAAFPADLAEAGLRIARYAEFAAMESSANSPPSASSGSIR